MKDALHDDEHRANGSRWRLATYAAVLVAIVAVVGMNARNEARRERIAHCAANFKQIGQAILLYTNEHRNRFPDSFVTLATFVPAADPPIDLAAFACPDADGVPPKSVADIAVGRCDYALVADSMRSQRRDADGGFNLYSIASAEEAVAIERPGHHPGGVHVLYADGHVEMCPISASRCTTWIETQDDAFRGKPIRWPASQPTR